MNALKGWNIINKADLHEMSKCNFSTEDRVKAARNEYGQRRKSCSSDKSRFLLVCEISKKYNVREEIILQYY